MGMSHRSYTSIRWSVDVGRFGVGSLLRVGRLSLICLCKLRWLHS